MDSTNSSAYEKFDRNFTCDLKEPDIEWHNAREESFDIYGLYEPREAGPFKRMPRSVAETVNPGVLALSGNTAGGRIRFTTNSRYVTLKYFGKQSDMPHMPRTGNTGFDLYLDEPGSSTYVRNFVSVGGFKDSYEGIIQLPEGLKHITINFPLYNNTEDLYIGIAKGSVLDHGLKYRYEKPVVYYGSSITQGGCASRPGNAYQSIISRMLDCDHINLGFSGSGKGEKTMAEYIAGLDMSVFFMDYDHNAPDADYLAKTHEAMYLTVRAKHPDMPIIMTSAVDTEGINDFRGRRQVIYKTYTNARSRGENVFFIDGEQVFGVDFRDCCTVDGAHPNDYGFVMMAKYFSHYIKHALEMSNK